MDIENLLAECLLSDNRSLELSNRNWEILLGQARQARLIARLAMHLKNGCSLHRVPDGPRHHLEGALKLANRQQHEVHWEVDRLRRALVGQRGPVILLKGAAYLMADLPPARGRLFADIDIMVPHAQIVSVEAALMGSGWICEELDAYNQRYYREWMHEIPPLRHVARNTYIDLHHTITPPTSRFNVNGQQLLERAIPLANFPGLFVLSPTDMVLHSAVHLFQEGEFGHGLRDLLDLNDLFNHYSVSEDFWDKLFARAEELRLGIPLFHALFHSERILGLRVPERLVSRYRSLGPSRISKFWMAWMLGHALRPEHPSCEHPLTGIARWMLYVRSHLLRMPLRLVIPHLIRKAWMRSFPTSDRFQ